MEGWDEQWMEKLLSKPAGFHLINVLNFKFTESAFTDVPPPIPRTDVNQSECSPQTDVTSLFKVHELIQEITQDNQVESVICTKMFKSITPLSQKPDFFYFLISFHMYLYCIICLQNLLSWPAPCSPTMWSSHSKNTIYLNMSSTYICKYTINTSTPNNSFYIGKKTIWVMSNVLNFSYLNVAENINFDNNTSLIRFDCYYTAVDAFHSQCFNVGQNDFALRFLHGYK